MKIDADFPIFKELSALQLNFKNILVADTPHRMFDAFVYLNKESNNFLL